MPGARRAPPQPAARPAREGSPPSTPSRATPTRSSSTSCACSSRRAAAARSARSPRSSSGSPPPRRGELSVELTTAYELSDEEARAIVDQIEQRSGRKVEATRAVDPEPDRRHRPPGRLAARRRQHPRPAGAARPRTRHPSLSREGARVKLRPEEITAILKERIKDFDVETDLAEVGTVLQVGDGIARVYGLESAVSLEMLELEHGVTGVALNLEEDNVGAALLRRLGARQGGRARPPHRPRRERPRRRRADRPHRRPARQPDRRRPAARRRPRRRPLEFKAPGVVQPPAGEGAAPDRPEGDRLDDPDRPRPARADHRRPHDRQDRDLRRHDPQPARPGRDLHLRRDRPEGLDRRPGVRAPEGGGRDGLHDHRHRRRLRGGADQVDGAVRRLRDGRVLHVLRAATRSASTTTSPSTRTPTGRCRCSCAARRAARRTRATSSTCTRGCSSARASSPTSSAAAR